MFRWVASLLLASSACSVCSAQQPLNASPSSANAALATPAAATGVGNDALMLLARHLSAMGGVDLTALQAPGTITLPGSTTQYPVSVVMLGSSFLRVNISKSNRLIGFAAKGPLHKSYYADGTSSIDAIGTGAASISAFQLLRTTDLVSKLLSLSKDSVSDASGKQYDRLRARQAFITHPGAQVSSHAQAAAVDYYFDKTTHYLVKSVTTVQVPGIVNPIPIETTYSDYRLAGTSTVPFHVSQVLNGQPDWDLALSSVTFPATLDASLTAF